jgi:hypothetical protein
MYRVVQQFLFGFFLVSFCFRWGRAVSKKSAAIRRRFRAF